MGNSMRRTKIVATLGPASSSPEMIARLIESGVNVFRLNFSHGNHEAHGEVYHRVRAAAVETKSIVAVMADLSGPKIRTTALEGGGPITLANGSELRIRGGEAIGGPGPGVSPDAEMFPPPKTRDR